MLLFILTSSTEIFSVDLRLMHLFISKLLKNHSCFCLNGPAYIIFVSRIFHCFVELFDLFLACLHSFRVTRSLVNVAFFFSFYVVNLKKLKGPFFRPFFSFLKVLICQLRS